MVKVNVHLPYKSRRKYLTKLIQLNLQPEFYFEGGDFENFDYRELEEISQKLKEKNLIPSIHSPFLDINLSAKDEEISKIVISRMLKTLDFAKILNAVGVVIHPGYDPFRYLDDQGSWFKNITKNIEPLLKKAEQLKIYLAVENIFEESYENLKKLLEHFSSPYLGHCFDTGHFNIFSRTSLKSWLEEMGKYFFSLHIHDNFGFKDDHIPVGRGTFPFRFFVSNLPDKNIKWITMEMHNEEEVSACLTNWNNLSEQKDNG
ncbi:MAG: sugar phosphate isomerase/epimerase [Proteobacteria bacterium]|nr:sugar phosphate isomerase/epimerase [Pseudomonadota bacterium]